MPTIYQANRVLNSARRNREGFVRRRSDLELQRIRWSFRFIPMVALCPMLIAQGAFSYQVASETDRTVEKLVKNKWDELIKTTSVRLEVE